jgi:hypothetical protein
MKKFTILAVFLVSDMPASASNVVAAWECSGHRSPTGDQSPITVELVKHATKAFELRISGAIYVWGTGHGYNVQYVGMKGAKLNGKLCRNIPPYKVGDEN